MSQPVPKVTRSDMERIVRRDFPTEDVADVFALLDEYGLASGHREVVRVQLAVLKLADGNREQLCRELGSARCDYRDTLVAAEYPGWGAEMLRIDRLSPEERQRIADADWQQYRTWLDR